MFDRTPRVLVMTPDFPPAIGGIQHLLAKITQNFTRCIPLVVTRPTPAFGDAEWPLGEIERLHRHWGRMGHRLGLIALNLLCLSKLRSRPDVILCGHIVLSPAAAVAGRLMGIPVVQYLYGEEVVSRPRLTRFAVRSSQKTIVISGFCEQLARRAVGDGPFVRIPCGVDTLSRSPTMHRESPPTLLTVARLTDAYKGHDVILRALPRVLSAVPDTRWVVVGDGPLRASLSATANRLGVGDAVLFLGSLSDAERDDWYGRAHVFVMPSRISPSGGGEGFGIVLLEAAAHGLPVVTANVGGPGEVVLADETGILVDPASPEAVANAVIRLLTDETVRLRMATAGIERAKLFGWPEVAAKVEEELLSLIRQGRGHNHRVPRSRR